MSRLPTPRILRTAVLAIAVAVVGCTHLRTAPDDGRLQREAMAGTHDPVPLPLPLNTGNETNAPVGTTPQISRGSGQFIQPQGLRTPRPAAQGPQAVTFNFENQPIQAVVKAILGDLLKQNYSIAPGVQGNVSFSTSEPVEQAQALPILETLLSWTGNALVRRAGGYVVLPQKDAVAGNVVPSLGANAPAGGTQARLFPLHFISATEMEKLLKPFARSGTILLADPARNLLIVSGTPDELANYQSMVRTFDVDWLRGMSVGVFNLQYASVGELMPKLDAMFGARGDTPLAGMLRFIPLERTNALVVISTQPQYLQEVGEWITRIDRGGGNQPQLFVYDVRNIKASDLARYLGQIYTNGGAGGGSIDTGGRVGPGLGAATVGSADNANAFNAMGSSAGSFGSVPGGTADANGLGASSAPDLGTTANGYGTNAGAQQYTSNDGSIRISSVDSSNQLLVRARASQWEEIKTAIAKLDHVPLQVQIETRILEVSLTGEFQFGVQYYLQNLQNLAGSAAGQQAIAQQAAALQAGVPFGGGAFFYSFFNDKLQVALRAIETSGNTKTLSAPSMVVMNNQVAMIQVGDKIPVNQTSINTAVGAATSYNQVSYMDTGVILKVQPRINPGGLVYMDISQQVSQPNRSVPLVNGNASISERKLATQVAVQSGQTVLLGGLIQQAESNTDTGIPGLNRVPILGHLFGNTDRSRNRTELIVLITPRVVQGEEDAKRITDDYQRKFESLAPLRTQAQERERPTTYVPAVTAPLPAEAAPPQPLPAAAPAVTAPATADPVVLQQQAQTALAQSNYDIAQALALRSWRAGTRHGSLCEQNWQLVREVRLRLQDAGGAETARKWALQCMGQTEQ
jgi:general secretion pathway protein D